MKRSLSFGFYPERAAVSDRHLLLLTLLVGSIGGLVLTVGLRVSLPGTLLLTAMLVALVGVLVVGQIKGPLLVLLGLSLPLHLDLYLGFYLLNTVSGPSEALARIALNDIVVAGLIFFWLWESTRDKGRHIELFAGVTVPAVLLLVLGTISMLSAPEPRLAVYQVLEWAKGLVLYIYLANCVRNERDLKWVLAGLMLGVLFQSLVGIVQGMTGQPIGLDFLGERMRFTRQLLAGQTSVRPSGTMWHTNQLAMYLGMTLPVIGAILLAPVSRSKKMATAFVLAAGLFTALLTLSRSTWLGLLTSALVLSVFGMKKRVLSPSSIVAGVIALVLVALAINLAIGGSIGLRLTNDDHGSAESRIPLMIGALKVIADYPLLGSGLKNYATTISRYDPAGEYTDFGKLPIVHNIFLLYAAEVGLLGMAAFIWVLVALGKRGLNRVGAHEVSLAVAVTAGLLASGLTLIMHNMVHVGLAGDPQLFVVFWFLSGLMVALTSWSRESSVTLRFSSQRKP